MDVEPDEQHVGEGDFHADEDDVVRSLFAAGWFRAVLVLTTLAVVIMLALPYLLDWFEPATSSVREPAAAKHGTRSASTPASQRMSSAARPRSEPAPVRRAATTTPTPEAPAARATPTLPGRSEPGAPSSQTVARPVHMVHAAGSAHGGERPPVASPKPSGGSSEGRGYWVQLGVFKELKNAEQFAKSVRDQGFPVQVASVTRSSPETTAGGTYHFVRAGAFPDQVRAAAARDDLRARGYGGFLAEGVAR